MIFQLTVIILKLMILVQDYRDTTEILLKLHKIYNKRKEKLQVMPRQYSHIRLVFRKFMFKVTLLSFCQRMANVYYFQTKFVKASKSTLYLEVGHLNDPFTYLPPPFSLSLSV